MEKTGRYVGGNWIAIGEIAFVASCVLVAEWLIPPRLVAVIFSLLHLPNQSLVMATFLGGLVWAAAYQRYPNLAALALSHIIMTVVVLWTLPASALHGLRVGAGYYLIR